MKRLSEQLGCTTGTSSELCLELLIAEYELKFYIADMKDARVGRDSRISEVEGRKMKIAGLPMGLLVLGVGYLAVYMLAPTVRGD